MARDAGLVDSGMLDDVADLPLAVPQGFDDKAARGVGQSLEGVYMHISAYAYQCMKWLSSGWCRDCEDRNS